MVPDSMKIRRNTNRVSASMNARVRISEVWMVPPASGWRHKASKAATAARDWDVAEPMAAAAMAITARAPNSPSAPIASMERSPSSWDPVGPAGYLNQTFNPLPSPMQYTASTAG